MYDVQETKLVTGAFDGTELRTKTIGNMKTKGIFILTTNITYVSKN